MKNTHNTARSRFFRRWVRKLFSSWVQHQTRNYLEEIFEKLQDIEDAIEIIARQIARQSKQGE